MGAQDIRRGMPVDAADGYAGTVQAVVLDRQSWDVTHLVIDRPFDDAWLIPIEAVAGVDGERVALGSKWSELSSIRRFRREEFYSVAEDTAEAGAADSGAAGDRRLELLEERLRVSKELELAGAIRMTRRVLEHTETVAVPVREERVVITCAPGLGPIRVGNDELREGEQLEITVMKERVIVHTEPVFLGGLVLRTEAIEGSQTVQAQLRREELTVDDPGGYVTDSGPPAPPA